VRTASLDDTRDGIPPPETPARTEPPTTAANAAARHTAVAEELAEAGRWEQAYHHLRTAVRLLHGGHVPDELDRLRREHAEAREQSRRDCLTDSYNRRYLDERLVTLLDDPSFTRTAGICIALVDVDHFKQINDTYGHTAGDAVLRTVAGVLASRVRGADFVARTGGEEFLVGCPGDDAETAALLGERLRDAVAQAVTTWPGHPGELRCTVSVGISRPFVRLADWQASAREADQALYAAKQAGRDRVVAADALRLMES
jgi:diguanylate cyclase (GGDEF)-like protein